MWPDHGWSQRNLDVNLLRQLCVRLPTAHFHYWNNQVYMKQHIQVHSVLRLKTLWSSTLLVHNSEMQLEIWCKQNKLCDLQSRTAHWAVSKNLLILHSASSAEYMLNIWQLICLLTNYSVLPLCSVSSRFLDLWFPELQGINLWMWSIFVTKSHQIDLSCV